MSMECDTRLSMMAMRQRAHNTARNRQSTRITGRARRYSASAAATMAAFALTLFTRGV